MNRMSHEEIHELADQLVQPIVNDQEWNYPEHREIVSETARAVAIELIRRAERYGMGRGPIMRWLNS